jgi:hypothetical protein
MDTLKKILKSRTVWTVVVMFLINGLTGIRDLIPAVALPFVDLVLGALAIYFRANPVQTFA